MRKFLLLCLPLTAFALEREPWFGNIWEFQLDGAYTYSRFHHVDNAKQPLKKAFNNNLLYLDLSVSPSPDWSADADIEIVSTTEHSGFQSGAAQFRYLWLDDVIGDPVSLTTGISMRGVTTASLRDISCPYHRQADLELSVAVGKEIENPPFWRFRLFGFAALGQANRGSPWARGSLAFQYNKEDIYQLHLFADSYWGFGHQRGVDVKHFHGYAHLGHQSIDIGAAYCRTFTYNGTLLLEYAHRVYARSYPSGVNFFTIRYQFPFSLF